MLFRKAYKKAATVDAFVNAFRKPNFFSCNCHVFKEKNFRIHDSPINSCLNIKANSTDVQNTSLKIVEKDSTVSDNTLINQPPGCSYKNILSSVPSCFRKKSTKK